VPRSAVNRQGVSHCLESGRPEFEHASLLCSCFYSTSGNKHLPSHLIVASFISEWQHGGCGI